MNKYEVGFAPKASARKNGAVDMAFVVDAKTDKEAIAMSLSLLQGSVSNPCSYISTYATLVFDGEAGHESDCALTLSDLNEKIDSLEVGESLVIDNLPNDTYHAANGYSKSSLDLINQSPALYVWSNNCPVDEDKMRTFDVGSAFHAMLLEPHKFDSEYFVGLDIPKRSNAEKAAHAEHEDANKGKILISSQDKKMLDLMVGSVNAHPMSAILKRENGVAEKSIFWRDPETSLVFKIRPDFVCKHGDHHTIIDVKSVANVNDFEKSVGDRRYHVQDAFYSWVYENAVGVEPLFAFCATSKQVECGKYKTRFCVLSASEKLEGNLQFISDIESLSWCVELNDFDHFEEIERPSWQKKNDLSLKF